MKEKLKAHLNLVKKEHFLYKKENKIKLLKINSKISLIKKFNKY